MSVKSAYNLWSSQYDSNKNKTRDLDKLMTEKMLSKIQFSEVLEIGCGTGKNTGFLAQNADQLTGIDFSEEMLKIARKKFPDKNVHFIDADITKTWPVADSSVNLVTFNLVLEHIEDLDFQFSEAFKKLKSGGYLFISELHPYKQYNGTKARFDTAEGRTELETFTHHISDFTKSATSAGFKFEKMEEGFDDGAETPRLISFLFLKT
ncbi:SAM-dependent methyltransferase [Christiangramia fulva]|uniref:SAM-dependent methyltransferase n=1 Tax=Christiangramia fulva TaxID=2126553 RepID=A0A2R3Z404_9FLAO|nr:class I SAM-dependent methyltransferase [Christiangramia fulva]AVR45006.1 SAM-dependent methyltransferase [Christiangramia fulva]